MNGRRRWVSVATAAVVLLAAAVGASLALSRPGGSSARGATAAPAATTTATVVRTDLRTTQQLEGTLGYATPITIVAATGGRVYSWLPAPGAVIAQGHALYEVDGTGVPLLYGDRPAWRTLASGIPPGRDVAQLNTALIRLGYARDFSNRTHFTGSTRAAVRRWQRASGLPITGAVRLGQAVFAPGPLRVHAVHVTRGAPPQPGEPLLDATSTTHVVDLAVPVDVAYLVHLNDPVVVTLPDGRTRTPATVSAISPVAVLPADRTDRGGSDTPVIDVTVSLAEPAAVAAYTSAPITVDITTAVVRGVLAVPVGALLARPDGSFAVTLVDGAGRREVPVHTGLFAQTLVEVSGPGLAEGGTVEVPVS